MVEKPTLVGGKKVVKEEEGALKVEEAAAAEVEMEMMAVAEAEAEAAVKEAKAGVEEENQVVMVENPLVEEASQCKWMKLALQPCLIRAVACPFQKNH